MATRIESRRSSRSYEPGEHFLWLMKRVFHLAHRAVEEAVHDHGITAAQTGILNRLAETPGLSGADLARRLLITPQAAQLAIAALEAHGLVERRPDANHGRIVRTYMTRKGRRVISHATAKSLAAEKEFLEVLDPGEQAQLIEFLQRLMRQHPDGDEAGDADNDL